MLSAVSRCGKRSNSLVNKQLLVRKQGKGTFVTVPAVRHDLRRLHGLLGSLFSQAEGASARLLHYEMRVPPADVAEALGLAAAQRGAVAGTALLHRPQAGGAHRRLARSCGRGVASREGGTDLDRRHDACDRHPHRLDAGGDPRGSCRLAGRPAVAAVIAGAGAGIAPDSFRRRRRCEGDRSRLVPLGQLPVRLLDPDAEPTEALFDIRNVTERV